MVARETVAIALPLTMRGAIQPFPLYFTGGAYTLWSELRLPSYCMLPTTTDTRTDDDAYKKKSGRASLSVIRTISSTSAASFNLPANCFFWYSWIKLAVHTYRKVEERWAHKVHQMAVRDGLMMIVLVDGGGGRWSILAVSFDTDSALAMPQQ